MSLDKAKMVSLKDKIRAKADGTQGEDVEVEAAPKKKSKKK